MSRRKYAVIAALILVVAALLRMWPLPWEALEDDELFSRSTAIGTLREGLAILAQDPFHPPAHTVLIRPFLAVAGDTPMGLRALSLTAGLATVAMLAGLGLLAPHMRGPGLLAAAIVAVNDQHIFFSQQARSYALYACIGLAMLGLFVWSERYASRRSFWFVAALVTTTGALTHFWFAVYVAVLVLATRKAWCADRVAWGWRAVAALAAAAVAVWLCYVFPSTRPQENLASLAWVGTASLFGLVETVALPLGVLDIRDGTTLSFWTVVSFSVAGLVVPAVGPEAAWTSRTQRRRGSLLHSQSYCCSSFRCRPSTCTSSGIGTCCHPSP